MKSILGELQCVVDQRFGSLDLGDRVSRNLSKIVGSGTYGIVYEGTLRPEQKVAVKVVRFGDKSALPVLEASILFAFVSTMSHDSILESSYRSICLVQAQTYECHRITWDYNCIRPYNIHSITIDVQGERV